MIPHQEKAIIGNFSPPYSNSSALSDSYRNAIEDEVDEGAERGARHEEAGKGNSFPLTFSYDQEKQQRDAEDPDEEIGNSDREDDNQPKILEDSDEDMDRARSEIDASGSDEEKKRPKRSKLSFSPSHYSILTFSRSIEGSHRQVREQTSPQSDLWRMPPKPVQQPL